VEEFYRVSPATSDGSTGVAGWVPLDTETYRAVDLASFRKWRVRDTAATNSHGLALSYELVPSPRDGTLRTTAAEGFMRGELWVTRAKPGERYVSTDQADLLSSYVNGESVAGTDVVLWYAMHSYHEVRSEDRPVLPVEWMTFQVRPRDFFDADPAP
jgi:primary-amine oxidase